MKYEPHSYQKYAIEYLKSHPVSALFLDCGLGKTSITLTAINELLFDSFEVPATVFKLWWIVPLVLNFISFNSGLETMINFALNLVFLGSTYAKMYAILDHKTEKETQTIGAVSGIVPIVAVVKFLMK